MNCPRVLLAAALAAFASSAAADPLGTAITYQGHLYDNGTAAANLYDMRFRLFDDDAGGTQIGDVLVESVPVENGQFTVNLDFGANAFHGQARWLEIHVGPENAPQLVKLDTRQRLKAAPEALHAQNVAWSAVSGVPTSISNGLQVGGLEGITTHTTGAQVAVGIDATYVQRRVTASCPGGALRSIAQDGSATCADLPNAATTPASHSVSIADESNSDRAPRLALAASGFPLVAHTSRDSGDATPRLTACNDVACAGADEATRNLRAAATDPLENTFAAVTVSPSGTAFVAWKSASGDIVTTGRCDAADCSSHTAMGGFVGLAPVKDLDIVGTTSGTVVAIHTDAGLRLGHCPSGNCAGQTSLPVPSLPTERPGLRSVFALADDGMPTLASIDSLNGTIWLVRCNDVACAGNDEAVNKVGIGGLAINVRTDALAMTLRDGLVPVIAAFAPNGSGVAVVSCNDHECSGNDETIRTSLGANAGGGLGVVIGNDGLPAIAFGETVDGSVKFAKCQSDDCTSMSPWVTVDDRNTVIDGLDMVLGVDGNPLIAYADSTGGYLRVVRCANRSCQ